MTNKRLLELKPEFVPLYSIFSDVTFSAVILAIIVCLLDSVLDNDILPFFFAIVIFFVLGAIAMMALCILKAFWFSKCTKYTIFDDRIELKQGIFNTTFTSIKLKNIREVHLAENLAQKFFSLGTIKFVTAANDSVGTGVKMIDIKYPDRAYERIKALIDNATTEKEG